MYKLTFSNNDESKKRFEILLHGLMIGGSIVNQKGLAVLRREINLLDKLEGISLACDCGKKIPGSNESDRELDFIGNTDDKILFLDTAEFDLLHSYIGSVPWTLGSSSRTAIATLDWMSSFKVN